MNNYSKFVPNVFLAKCEEKHERGETIMVTTHYGKENECIVFNLIYEREGCFYYSIVRADGMNAQEFARKRAERYETASKNAVKISYQYYHNSHAIIDNIPFGQPIMVGHHSERAHRNALDRSRNQMGKSVEYADKAQGYESKAEYWKKRANIINLSMPESVEYFEYRLEKAKKYHEGLKSGKYLRKHSYSLTYAKKEVNEMEHNYQLAKRLWS